MNSHPMVKLALGVVFLYFVYAGLFFIFQRRLVFPRHLLGTPGAGGHARGVETLWIDTPSGKVEAWYLPAGLIGEGGPAPAVIFAHGNGEVIDFWPELLREFNRLGLGVLLVEYPGYGRSEGLPSQQRIADAFVAAYDTLVSRAEVDASRIVLFGRSLGGGAVCALAAQRPAAALILMSTFTSIRAMARKFLLPGFLARDPFDNLSVVRAYPGPVLVVHGRVDTIVPYAHGLELDHAARRSKMITYRCGHNNCPPDWEAFWEAVAGFLREAGVIASR